MIPKVLLIFLLINSVQCETHLQKKYALNTAIEQTTTFFEKLRSNYDKSVLTEIDGKIVEHVRNLSKTIFVRHKRKVSEDSHKGIDVFQGFQDFSQLNFNNVQDLNFFSLQNELESTWFAAILDTINISIFRIDGSALYHVTAYPLTNGVQINVHSCTYGALLIIKNDDGSILVLRFAKEEENYRLRVIQNFESNVTHLAVWNGMNQLYLGIASHSNISIFTWFGDYFDLDQTINHGTKKLFPFYSKGFMYLAATGSTTLIFKYFLRSNEFVLTQRLPSSRDISSFQISENHFTEHFLSLSTESSIVIYKEIHDRFVPFQQIFSGKSAVPMISNNVILVLTLHEDTVFTYQYNGWRFVELDIKLSKIHQFRRIMLYGKELLLVKYKNDTWKLKQLTWTKKKSYKDLQEEIKAWNIDAMETAQRTLKEIPNLKNPIRILKGHINQLFVYNINEHNSQALRNVSRQYKKLVSKIQKQKDILSNKLHFNNLTLPFLRAKNVQINCETKCKVNRLKISEYEHLSFKLRKMTNENEVLNLKNVRIKEIKNWKCPLFSLPVTNVIVNKSINGLLLQNLQEKVLKVIGDQEVSGKHVFHKINATNASIPLNIAFNLTKQKIETTRIEVKQLNLMEGGFLLPLNGPPTVMAGSIKASKIRVKNNIFLKAGPSGNWKKYTSPVTIISNTMMLNGDRILDNTKIEYLRSRDLIANQAGSIKHILSKTIPLRDNMPVSLTLSGDKVVWNNVTLHGPQNWITVDSPERIEIFGRKHISHNVKVSKSSYENLKVPKIETPLCGATVIIPEMKTAVLLTNNITVKVLNSTNVSGNLGEKYLTDNATFLFKPLNVSNERFYHNVTVKNISTTDMNNVDFTELKKLLSSWIKPNVLKTSIQTSDLIIGVLQLPVRFHRDLPKVVGNIITEQNTYVGSMNKINVADFLTNAIKVEDMIFLGNVTFGSNFTTNHILVSQSPLTVNKLESNPNLYKKHIIGSIITKVVNLPKSFSITENEEPFNIVVKGSATFPNEPTIQNINKMKLEELFTNIWMLPDVTVFSGKYLHIENASIKGNITLNNFSNVLNPEMWTSISKRVLSKTQPQEITVLVSLNHIEAPAVAGFNTSDIKITDPSFSDVFENALLRNKKQRVKAKWTFNKLKVLGKLNAKGKINDMNLETDVMKHNSENIIVSSKKTVVSLAAENLNGLKFDEWTRNALTQKKKISIIRGRKSFNTVTVNKLNVSGTIMSYDVSKALLKSGDQTVSGQISVQGFVNASELVIDGLINDVNLTNLMNRQLQKQKPVQRIKANMRLPNVLKIVGNVTINGSYGNAKLENFHTNSNAASVVEKMNKYATAAKAINTVLRNRAVYINKLEVVKNASVTNISNKNLLSQKEQYKTNNFSQLCINDHDVNRIFEINSNQFVLIKSILLDENEFLIGIKFDSVSIYVCNNAERKLFHLQDVHVPKIIDAFVESALNSLWIALKLTSQTLVLHYQFGKDLQEYILPATDVFIMSRSPNGQLLLLLSDGVWNLEGLASPQQIIDLPFKGMVETLIGELSYYVKCSLKNNTTLMRARYAGN